MVDGSEGRRDQRLSAPTEAAIKADRKRAGTSNGLALLFLTTA